jgi:hypothetical protein
MKEHTRTHNQASPYRLQKNKTKHKLTHMTNLFCRILPFLLAYRGRFILQKAIAFCRTAFEPGALQKVMHFL